MELDNVGILGIIKKEIFHIFKIDIDICLILTYIFIDLYLVFLEVVVI